MKLSNKTIFCGIGKTLFNSSVCHFPADSIEEVEILLTERISRIKASGAWPEMALKRSLEFDQDQMALLDNRDVNTPAQVEEYLNQRFPFYEKIEKLKIEKFLHQNNTEIQTLSHHLAHAYAALFMSPYQNSLIVVIDGAGSRFSDFENNSEFKKFPAEHPDCLEECSVFLQDGGKVSCIQKFWQRFEPDPNDSGQQYSQGIGSFYEKLAEYIFNSKRAAGKVMGLSAFGKPLPCQELSAFLSQLDWSKSYTGNSKEQWEKTPHRQLYCDLAATAQEQFEEILLGRLKNLKGRYPAIENIILTGGCALNCVSNTKIQQQGIFKNVYVPPFPGDECIGLGCSSYGAYQSETVGWRPRTGVLQHAYFGSKSNIPTESNIRRTFVDFKIEKSLQVAADCARLLEEGHIIAWFQGRGESGPRALGNRSILANPCIPGVKETLNKNIKFREEFRPYGCSVNSEHAGVYFELPAGLESPYMSFAVPVQEKYLERLKGITHCDGSSRIQMVTQDQNKLFHYMLDWFGQYTGVYCLLNTSLNIMGQPIVESLEDLKEFMINSSVEIAVVGDCIVTVPNE
ncbi:MAG: hypothetical protein HN509_02565 [Halobacteriovoraceae bacterium]|jgi:carbamoyltransferase|nr:hypothetical protein [Halobacteriovoraceae bacterium]MBT5095514.1 hypothetical protein [Halobacteriovoraceae bacterium]